ncbi:unnamed protein product [Cochlearia groenlandica]
MANHGLMSIADIKRYIATQLPQTINFSCVATIEDVVAIPLWNSKICHACFSEIVQSEIAVVCTNDDCKKPLRLGFTRAHYGDVPTCLLYSIGCAYKFITKLAPYNVIERLQPTPCSRNHGAIADVKFG